MRYLWEVLLEAKKEQIPEERLRFVHAPQGSGYMELSLPCLNQTWLGEEEQPEDINIEVNTYYRFYDIFCEMFPPDEAEFPSLRESLTNLCLHMLAQNDIRMGMTREDYHKRLLAKEILDGTRRVSDPINVMAPNRFHTISVPVLSLNIQEGPVHIPFLLCLR